MPDYEPTDPAREANQVSDAFFDPDCIVSAVRIPAELTANALGQPTADDTAANSGERPRVQEYRGVSEVRAGSVICCPLYDSES